MKKIIFPILAISLMLGSCKKYGCTNADALNYDSKAKTDNGTCNHEGSAVFWYNQAAANSLVADGASSLSLYVNNTLSGSQGTNTFFAVRPDCGADGSMSVTKDLGNLTVGNYTYSVVDQTGYLYWSGSLIINSNTCEAIELVW